jgi:hypothetical protein
MPFLVFFLTATDSTSSLNMADLLQAGFASGLILAVNI